MNQSDYHISRHKLIVKTLVQEQLFGQWLRNFFFLNKKLYEEYDTIYQKTYYTKLYGLLTEGLEYAKKALSYLQGGENIEKLNWYQMLVDGLQGIKSDLSEIEFQFIEYKRHSACHIFQEQYESQLTRKGKVKQFRKNKHLNIVNAELSSIILKHGSDKKFDLYLIEKLYFKTTELYNKLLQNGSN